TVTSVQGGGVATWVKVTDATPDGGGGAIRGSMWYGFDSTGGTSAITVNFSGGFNVIVRAAELDGIGPSIDGFAAQATGARTTLIATGLVTTSGDDVLWAM